MNKRDDIQWWIEKWFIENAAWLRKQTPVSNGTVRDARSATVNAMLDILIDELAEGEEVKNEPAWFGLENIDLGEIADNLAKRGLLE